MKNNIIDYFKTLVDKGRLCCYSTPDGKAYVDVKAKGKSLKQYELNDKELIMAIRELLEEDGKFLECSCYAEIINELEYLAFKNPLSYNLSKRCVYTDGVYVYDLNAEEGQAICIDEEGISEMDTPDKVFFRTKTFENQVYPDCEVDSTELPSLLKKHMNLGEESLLLMAIYLVCAFLGCLISVPILVLTGEKGSAKTTMIRRIEKIVDPKMTDLGGASSSVSNLEIRLHNNYFCALDNLSDRSISRKMSDVLCRAVTGGTTTKRKLYTDADEVVLELKSVVAINGVTPVFHESDLADRILLIKTQRLNKKELLTDEELDNSFEADRPAILGCIFQLLGDVLNDDEPLKVQERTRLASFFEYAVKVGRALGYEDEVTADLLWKNQRQVNNQSLSESPVAQCVIELMKDRKEYKDSVSNALGELRMIAEKNYINQSLLPSQPNVLSRRLNEIKSNLETKNIYYDIRNIGSFRQIHLYKKHKKRK